MRGDLLKGAAVTIASLLLSFPAAAGAKTLDVGAGFPFKEIGSALRRAADGDVVRIHGGVYRENLHIRRSIILEGIDSPVVDGGGKGHVIRLDAPGARLSGLVVRNSGLDLTEKDSAVYVEGTAAGAVIEGNRVESTAFGIWINGANEVQIRRNHVIGDKSLMTPRRGNGIHIWNVKKGVVEENIVEGARDGIFVDWTTESIFRKNRIFDLRYGFHYMFSHNNRLEENETFRNGAGLALMYSNNLEIRGNIAYDNRSHGIMMQTMRNCRVYGNTVVNAEKGLFIYDSQYNDIANNLIADNDIGVHIWAGAVDNLITSNDLISNRSQVKYVAAKDEEWSVDGRGNHWSDYLGWDMDEDGIGDLPHLANTMIERLIWTYPVIKLLLNSPAVQTVRMVENQFPILRAPSVTDGHPLMRPGRGDWKSWVGRGTQRGSTDDDDSSEGEAM